MCGVKSPSSLLTSAHKLLHQTMRRTEGASFHLRALLTRIKLTVKDLSGPRNCSLCPEEKGARPSSQSGCRGAWGLNPSRGRPENSRVPEVSCEGGTHSPPQSPSQESTPSRCRLHTSAASPSPPRLALMTEMELKSFHRNETSACFLVTIMLESRLYEQGSGTAQWHRHAQAAGRWDLQLVLKLGLCPSRSQVDPSQPGGLCGAAVHPSCLF